MNSSILIIALLAFFITSSIDGFLFCPSTRKYYQPHPRRHRTEKQVLAKSRRIIENQKQPNEVKIEEPQEKNPWIIVVEDEDYLRNAIGKYISKEGGGCHVTGVADARSAFLLCRGIFKPTSNRYTSFKFDPNYNATNFFERPDCIILDVRLGGEEIDGIALLKIIRSDAYLESLPVILLTAKGKVDDRIAGYEAGADAYITKPFDPEELLSVLEGVLTRKVVLSGSDAAAIKGETKKSKDTVGLMKEIRREIEEIKSLLWQKNTQDITESKGSNVIQDVSDTSASFSSIYKDLNKIKEDIKATTSTNLQPINSGVQIQHKVTLSDIKGQFFTPEEKNVISLIEQELTTRVIAQDYLNCSESKVEKIISSLFKKTGTKNRPQLVEWFKQNSVSKLEQDMVGVVGVVDKLNAQEKEIMELLGKGLTNKEIAANTGVSLKEVVTVVNGMLDRARVKNRTELMRFWNSEGNKI